MSVIDPGTIPLTIVAAVARNGVIGGGNALLWRLSSDLQRFKALTMGKPLIMGRKTFESIGRPLPGRETIVVTRNRDFSVPGVHVAASIDEAIDIARDRAIAMGAPEVIIAGGGEIYALTMDRAQRLVITHVAAELEGDAHFPAIDPKVWKQVEFATGEQTAKDEVPFAFAVYERAGNR